MANLDQRLHLLARPVAQVIPIRQILELEDPPLAEVAAADPPLVEAAAVEEPFLLSLAQLITTPIAPILAGRNGSLSPSVSRLPASVSLPFAKVARAKKRRKVATIVSKTTTTRRELAQTPTITASMMSIIQVTHQVTHQSFSSHTDEHILIVYLKIYVNQKISFEEKISNLTNTVFSLDIINILREKVL